MTLEWLGKKVDMISVFPGDRRECCANCQYFEQHYIWDRYRGGYMPICWGHCKTKIIKNRNAIDHCPMFERKTGDEK